jgi:Flp pilus assembly protein TadG
MRRNRSQDRLPRRATDRGAVAVEFALIVIPLLILVSGIIQFGIAYNAQETLTSAARAGARQAAVCGATCVSAASVASAAQASGVNVAAGNVSITYCAPGATQTSSAQVSITSTVGGISNLLNLTFTITGKASMPCGG